MFGKSLQVLVVAGETSGDLHGSKLVRELKTANPQIEFFGIGGDRMKQEGVVLIEHVDRVAVVGFTEVIKKYPPLKKAFQQVDKEARNRGAARAILIDYPGFNLRLAKRMKKLDIPVTYFISPQLWAWREKRVQVMKECVDQVLCIFPFEEKWYRERGIHATFVGHPLMEGSRVTISKQEFFETHGLRGERITVALLPGSRQQEVDRHLRVMLESIWLLKEQQPEVQGVIGKAPGVSLGGFDLGGMAVESETPQVALRYADVGIIASGTATLEAAIYGTPSVVIYKMSRLSYSLARKVATVPFASITNLIAEFEVLPELLQDDATAQNIADTLRPMILFDDVREKVASSLKGVRKKLGGPGAIRMAAGLILQRLS